MSEILRIAALCRNLVSECGSQNPFEMAEKFGVRILPCPDFQNLEGMYKVVLDQPFVFLKGSLSRERARQILAHELGHHFLHREMGEDSVVQDSFLVDMTLKPEYEANLFAAELLIPDENILPLIGEGASQEEAAKKLRMHPSFVELKLRILKEEGKIPKK